MSMSISSFHYKVSVLIFLLGWPIYCLSAVLKISHYYCIICAYKSISVFLMKLDAPTFGAYMSIIVNASWWIVPFINIKCPSLSLGNCGLESVLSYMRIGTPACFQGLVTWKIFFCNFTLSQCFSFHWDILLVVNKWADLY
jgi:hypothetical protein